VVARLSRPQSVGAAGRRPGARHPQPASAC
jgi:hypothetical protein